MRTRISALLVAVVLFVNSSVNIFACDEEQSNYYVLKILFGDEYLYYENNKDAEKLLSALYLCSQLENEDGQDKLNVLKKAKVRDLPTIDELNTGEVSLYECSHNSWDYELKNNKDAQDARKEVLRKTTIRVLNFGWFNEIFRNESGKIDSFAALLYYSHILADYLADDPMDTQVSVNGVDVPAYCGQAYRELNGNRANFSSKQKKETESYKEYSEVDNLGSSGVGISCIGPDTLENVPKRQSLKNPTGWIDRNSYNYKDDVMVSELYNRCHLTAHCLGGANTLRNLVTGTKYMNLAMEKKEIEVLNYIKKTGNHVLYRATPIYKGNNLVANGVQLEAYSVEDKGKGIQFNMYFYNVQPGIDINYGNGDNKLADKTLNRNDILPFATVNPSDQYPDLMHEISKQLEILFEDQKKSSEYKDMMEKLQSIADNIRSKGKPDGAKEYQNMKKFQYEYVEILSEYIPELLKNEKFFNKVFRY